MLAAVIVGCAESPTEVPSAVEQDQPTERVADPRPINTTPPGSVDPTQTVSDPVDEVPSMGDELPDETTPLIDEKEPIHGQMTDPVDIGLLPEVIPPHRDLKRMDIDQLRVAIAVATGSEGWVVNGNEQFEVLSRTLGKPDYLDLTSEDLSPTALFQKFLDDAARSVCYALADNELVIPPEERVLMVHAGPEDTYKDAPEKIEDNLSLLLKRYHGRHAPAGSPELQSFRWLYQSAEHVSKDPVKAWRTVCIGLIVHPAFYTY